MSEGKIVILMPTQSSDAGIKQLEKQLTGEGVEVFGNQGGFVFAQWDEKARHAIPGNALIKAYFLNKVSSPELAKLNPSAKRVATVWNWKIDKAGKPVTESAIKKLLISLQYEERRGEIYDLLTNKSVGKIERKMEKEKAGNWDLLQTRSTEWYTLPGFTVRKLQCTSSSTPTICTQIIAEVMGPKHYAYSSKSNASSANACDWSVVWWWQHWTPATAFSWGISGGEARTILSTWR